MTIPNVRPAMSIGLVAGRYRDQADHHADRDGEDHRPERELERRGAVLPNDRGDRSVVQDRRSEV
jgi:hypothetical protein